ncbi:MAG: phosphotransferase family protein [Micrococcales bacterium]|nr:phosphotransferase family protein [Micrococcales bacterium]
MSDEHTPDEMVEPTSDGAQHEGPPPTVADKSKLAEDEAKRDEEQAAGERPDGNHPEHDGVPGASEVRGEDAFDVERMAQWLRENASDATGLDGVPRVRQFTGGASNLTYLLRYPERDLILRRPPVGTKAKGAHDMGREYRIQSALTDAFPLVPAMVAFCQDESVMGGDFYVMDRIDGIIPRTDLPPEMQGDRDHVAALCRNAVDVLAQLHSVDVEAAGLTRLGKGDGYVERQVRGWSERFRKARTRNVGNFESTMQWLADHQPKDVRTCLIHNDFRLDNLVFDKDDPTKVIGVLDWEMATLGDPLMDLGGALAYWVEAKDDFIFRKFRRQPTHTPGMMTRAEVVQAYAEQSGIEIDPKQWTFYEVFGLFRLAVIAQQIYYRYFHKQTTNRAYRNFHSMVLYLDYRCRRLIIAHDRHMRRELRDLAAAAEREASAEATGETGPWRGGIPDEEGGR